ncbi:MAG: hypothetical protein QXH80_04715 [Candidatus Nanoarchaeia archaeon]
MVNFGIIAGLLGIIFGILVAKYPKIIAWLVGAYFVITGLITLLVALAVI